MSRTVSEAPPSFAGLAYFAAAFPFLCALSLGLVPALKGSAVGIDSLIGYSDLFSDALSQLGAIGTLLLGTTSLVPFIQRRTHLFEAALFSIAALYAYLILMAASRVILPDAWIAISALCLGLAFFPLLGAGNRAALFLVPVALRLVGTGLGSLELQSLPEIPRRLVFSLAAMTDLGASALALAGLFVVGVENRRTRSALLFSTLLIAIPLGATLAVKPAGAGLLGYVGRAFGEVADQAIVAPGYAGALLLPTCLVGFTGIVTGRIRVIGAAAATLLAALAPTPLTIAAFATLTLRIYVEGASSTARKESAPLI